MTETQNRQITGFGNLIARCRRDARRIIAGKAAPNMRYRLGLIGERLVAAFPVIDDNTTLDQRLMLIGANPADARHLTSDHDSMLHLIWVESLEWSAMRRADEWNGLDRAPLYWAVSYVMIDWMRTDEAKSDVDAAFRHAFGKTFDDLATGNNDD
ncbi:MAG: hypothetical protein RL291_995 [Pseudomonadota bacterium]